VQPPHPVTPDLAGRRGPGWPGFDWRTLGVTVYLVIAGVMLLRLVIGMLLSFRLARAARPLQGGWVGGAHVRVSDDVAMPVTFGSTVLLPAEYADWTEAKRSAVLSHERAHVTHGDFYVLLLAALNRAVFWFNPFAWWQLIRMAELAEIISDDAALEMLDDRLSYVGILLDFVGGRDEPPIATAMARACTLRKRVERILAGTAVPARLSWRKRTMVAIALSPAVLFSAGAVMPGASKPSAESVAARPGTPVARADTVEGEPHPLDRYVGYYEFAPFRAVAVARSGDHLILHETGRLKVEVMANGSQAFVSQDTWRNRHIHVGHRQPHNRVASERAGREGAARGPDRRRPCAGDRECLRPPGRDGAGTVQGSVAGRREQGCFAKGNPGPAAQRPG